MMEQERGASKAATMQMSATEPETQVMKQPGGFAASYNLQLRHRWRA
jgi:hypothetical protein